MSGIVYWNTIDSAKNCTAVVEHRDGRLELPRHEGLAAAAPATAIALSRTAGIGAAPSAP